MISDPWKIAGQGIDSPSQKEFCDFFPETANTFSLWLLCLLAMGEARA